MKKWDKEKIKYYIMNEASEKDMVDIIEIMKARKAILDLKKVAAEKEEIIKRIKNI